MLLGLLVLEGEQTVMLPTLVALHLYAWPSMLCCAVRNAAKAAQEAWGFVVLGVVRSEMQRFRHVTG